MTDSEVRWPYTKRADGRIAVTIDNNVWDFLFENAIDLVAEFPFERFALFITREVEIEIEAIPGKETLHEYIDRSKKEANVVTAGTIGFDNGDRPIRNATLGQGTFQTPLQAEVRATLRSYFRPKPKRSGLYDNEGDIAVAVASLFSVVLTRERPGKPGPLRYVRERGGKIVHLYGMAQAAPGALRQLVENCFSSE